MPPKIAWGIVAWGMGGGDCLWGGILYKNSDCKNQVKTVIRKVVSVYNLFKKLETNLSSGNLCD